MAWVNPQVSRAVPAPVPMVTCTHDLCGFTCSKQSKISQNGQELSELWSKHSQLWFDHNSLNTKPFWLISGSFCCSQVGKSIPHSYPSLPVPMTRAGFVNLYIPYMHPVVVSKLGYGQPVRPVILMLVHKSQRDCQLPGWLSQSAIHLGVISCEATTQIPKVDLGNTWNLIWIGFLGQYTSSGRPWSFHMWSLNNQLLWKPWHQTCQLMWALLF